MPSEYTRADSLYFYLTGAAADGGAQANPNQSLGKFRSSTEVAFLGITVTNPIANITVVRAGGANGLGAGSLYASGADDLKWTPPGGVQGAAVTIANGETKVLEGGGSDGHKKFLRVTRTTADALTGTATVTLASVFNDAVGFDNISTAEALAGDDEYRCICIKNESAATIKNIKIYVGTIAAQLVSDAAQLGAAGAGTIGVGGGQDFSDWPSTGAVRIETNAGVLREVAYYSSRTLNVLTVPAGGRQLFGAAAAGAADDKIYPVPLIELGKDAPTAQPDGQFEDETADEDVSPGAMGWTTGILSTTGLDIGDLAAGEIYGIWIHRRNPAAYVAVVEASNYFITDFESI